ncbi:hypothetical protein RF11_08163 [Thelohanellus kitauei]|uniref:Uncharacterized protein n=1 Tax=Thelohanellus kitauei TaxID=669202 RepID=A0A0C2JUE1_THEKT|nr:hypothetical protein RF11_08163 [Thelohanellus kitauei]
MTWISQLIIRSSKMKDERLPTGIKDIPQITRQLSKFYAEFNILDVFYGIEETGLVEVDDENYQMKHGDFQIKYLKFVKYEKPTFTLYSKNGSESDEDNLSYIQIHFVIYRKCSSYTDTKISYHLSLQHN